MKETTMKGKVLSGLFWKIMENGGVQVVQFIVTLVLARILSQEEYGVISILTIFIVIANVFIQQGFSTALVQKKEADQADFSSVFFLSLGIAGILYAILFAAAPVIANFYEVEKLTSLLRVLALVLFFGAASSIGNAMVARQMRFRHLFLSSLGAVILSGVIGIYLAKQGAGEWALVAQQLSYQIVYCAILYATLRWHPSLIFSLEKIKVLFSFGWKLLCSALLDTVYNNLYGLIIGKVYNAATLASYDKGNQFPQLIVNNVNGAIQAVMLPALSEKQDDRQQMKSMMRRSIITSSFVVFPMMAGLMAVAEPLISLLLTDKWLSCVPFLRLMCLDYALWPIHTANLQAINAMGRSDIFLKLELVKKCMGLALLCAGLPFGVFVMVALKPVSSFIAVFINAFPNRRLLDYKVTDQWKDVRSSFLLSAVMGVCVYAVSFIGLGNIPTLLLQVCTGVVIYGGLAALFKVDSYCYFMNTLRQMKAKKAGKSAEEEN